jgi:hypothetical protein
MTTTAPTRFVHPSAATDKRVDVAGDEAAAARRKRWEALAQELDPPRPTPPTRTRKLLHGGGVSSMCVMRMSLCAAGLLLSF